MTPQRTPQRYYSNPSIQQQTPQRYYGNSTPQRTPQHVNHHQQQAQQIYATSRHQSKLHHQQHQEDPILKLIVAQLNFQDAPIFSIFHSARDRVLHNFSGIMHEVEQRFITRNMDTLALTCESFLLRDMAFCTDEQQLRVAYQQAIRTYILALLQPRCSIIHVRNHLQAMLKRLFTEIVQSNASILPNNGARENDHFIIHSVGIFIDKNHSIVTDCLCALIDRHAEQLANQSSSRCLNERTAVMLGDRSRELKRFIGKPRNIQEVNDKLPPKLRRSMGQFNAEDFQIYLRFEEFGDQFHYYMEKYGLQDLKAIESASEVEEDQQQQLLAAGPVMTDEPEENPVVMSDQEDELLEKQTIEKELTLELGELKECGGLPGYVEALYKNNPHKNPKFFYEYVRLLMQQGFLTRLMSGEEMNVASGRECLVLLVMPVLRMIMVLQSHGKFPKTPNKFTSTLSKLFTFITTEHPEAFNSYCLSLLKDTPVVFLRPEKP